MDAFSPDPQDRDAPGPLAWVELADGQSVTAQVIGRLDRRSSGGGWWYEVRLPVWAEVRLPDRVTVEPDSVVMRVPARLVTSIEGTDYSAVPTQRQRPPARPPRSSLTAPAGRWSMQHLPAPAGGPGRRVIHHESCWIPTGAADLTLDQALRELTRPGSEPCTACDARHLPTS
ncbi:DUF6233 domain-containing protein [Streptomyces violaceusniger]|uniref:Uncharacterized protein n=1 Tax=Streptomyces violaceusniger (strain Tu 4113) TaxID=653045 RepID=G2NVP6_STRV4|nr:DUF6233 domain-containing protein [Streptomyces violaceusniger]AEM85930.1 hypothetical protein Strvi_6522 [Streptomyces violaceusniger Tu 4113]